MLDCTQSLMACFCVVFSFFLLWSVLRSGWWPALRALYSRLSPLGDSWTKNYGSSWQIWTRCRSWPFTLCIFQRTRTCGKHSDTMWATSMAVYRVRTFSWSQHTHTPFSVEDIFIMYTWLSHQNASYFWLYYKTLLWFPVNRGKTLDVSRYISVHVDLFIMITGTEDGYMTKGRLSLTI